MRHRSIAFAATLLAAELSCLVVAPGAAFLRILLFIALAGSIAPLAFLSATLILRGIAIPLLIVALISIIVCHN